MFGRRELLIDRVRLTVSVLLTSSSLLSIKQWVEQPLNNALSKQLEARIDWSSMGAQQSRQAQTLIRDTRRHTNRYMIIGLPGTALWLLAVGLVVTDSSIGPLAVLLGGVSKIVANIYNGDIFSVFFDIFLMLASALMWILRYKNGQNKYKELQ